MGRRRKGDGGKRLQKRVNNRFEMDKNMYIRVEVVASHCDIANWNRSGHHSYKHVRSCSTKNHSRQGVPLLDSVGHCLAHA
jgi:hypothetical protein